MFVRCLRSRLSPDPISCSEFIQEGSTAFLAKGQGKGRSCWKPQGRNPSNLSIEDRRKNLQELKARTECKDCGRKGHWKGDKECPLNKQRYERKSHLAVKSNSDDSMILNSHSGSSRVIAVEHDSVNPSRSANSSAFISAITMSKIFPSICAD